MPQVEIKCSSDLREINFDKLFKDIAITINDYDSSAGACKSRAYLTDIYQETHIYVSVWILKKQHRDDQFMKGLQEKLVVVIKKSIPKNCHYALELEFSGNYYLIGKT